MPKLQNKTSISHLLLLHGTLLLYVFASVFAKYAGNALNQKAMPLALLFLFLEFLFLFIYSYLWQQVLKRMPLNFAYTNKAICTIWTVIFAIFCFGESLTLQKGIGIFIVLVGVLLVVSDNE